ncbi:T9SS type A sorting domain-containing protein [Ulvibacter antarcticus]|uniref:Putative repeat protein (TIGR01451 family)/predicted secreted protein (Por secretion system target) n=1 Tax=Ulvibacter antarcticus TaxID=442714 RepID=A0A3L9YG71_9FLAO|nr:T9SS type A sorting domain-containing protein [Ulvibacter antarcticus]RMA58527.1 putative repeat protein (TIGR01451 family)/predicted secreted protein (Por secretion system target) [Ulvibacter antarcticus]
MKKLLFCLTLCSCTFAFSQAQMGLVKQAQFNDENDDGCASIGETISYFFQVSNYGTELIENIMVSDILIDVTGSPISLNPGEVDTTTFTGVYALTQDDLNEEHVINQAVAEGMTTGGDTISDLSDDSSFAEDDPTITNLCVLGVEDQLKPVLVKMYPNPVQDEIQFELAAEVGSATVNLYSVIGVEILNQEISSENKRIDVSHLASGTYFVTVLVAHKVSSFTLLKD